MERLKRKIAEHQPIVGAVVGSGMGAAAAELGEVDLLMVLSASYFRLHGCSPIASFMPYSNANELMWQIATQYVIPRTRHTPIFLGVCAQDAQLNLNTYLYAVKERNIAGITNFPSVGFIDGAYRKALEETGLGFEREVEMLAQAQKHGLLTIGFCFNPEETVTMAHAGVDILCLGLVEERSVDPDEHQADLDRAVSFINRMIASVKPVPRQPPIVVAGGPILLPQDTVQLYQRTEALGYIGGSAIERFPAASVITQTVREFKQMAEGSRQVNRLGAMIGISPAMQRVFEIIRCVAQSDAPVLIVGESGTGKELAAREIYRLSNRNRQPFVGWNCGAVTESLAMSELFGHEKGAFTGAASRHVGKFELANNGTLFMDEITDLPLSVQASLLRVIQEKEIVRVGGEKNIRIDVRLITASNQDLRELIQTSCFRLDLYYRLSTVVLRIPPLRERREDISFLISEFAREFSRKYGYPVPHIPQMVMDAFLKHTWPGNIRELRNAVERCFILGQGETFSLEWLDGAFALDKPLKNPYLEIARLTSPKLQEMQNEKSSKKFWLGMAEIRQLQHANWALHGKQSITGCAVNLRFLMLWTKSRRRNDGAHD